MFNEFKSGNTQWYQGVFFAFGGGDLKTSTAPK